MFQRSNSDADLYRLSLIKRGSSDYDALTKLTGDATWGTIEGYRPLSQQDIVASLAEQNTRQAGPFSPFDSSLVATETRAMRVARSLVFSRTVRAIYGGVCCVCGTALRSPAGQVEIDAAHIVPRGQQGTDDARNGLALCKRHHWAFDRGLFGINRDRTVIVPRGVADIRQNQLLAVLAGKPMREATDKSLAAHPEALEWHRINILVS